MLTPSSNTTLEPVTTAMLSRLAEVSAHFSRFPVTEISLRGTALSQFDDEKILQAARLLADAHVDVIGWNGTSSGWLGFDADKLLCERITAVTGIPATTSVLALNEILAAKNARDFGLVTPYLDDVQKRIVENYQRSGFHCVAERHLGLDVNFAFASVTGEQIESMARQVAAARPQAISTFCTNLKAAPLVNDLERELSIPIYDTIATVVWKSLRIAGVDTRRVSGWGSLFAEDF
jgi:maleate isomerase